MKSKDINDIKAYAETALEHHPNASYAEWSLYVKDLGKSCLQLVEEIQRLKKTLTVIANTTLEEDTKERAARTLVEPYYEP